MRGKIGLKHFVKIVILSELSQTFKSDVHPIFRIFWPWSFYLLLLILVDILVTYMLHAANRNSDEELANALTQFASLKRSIRSMRSPHFGVVKTKDD